MRSTSGSWMTINKVEGLYYGHPDTTGRPLTLPIVIQIPLVDLRLYL